MNRSLREWWCLSLGLVVAVVAFALSPPRGGLLAAPRPQAAPSDGWPPLAPEERGLTRVEQDPDADAVVLINQRDGKILQKGSDTVNVLDYHRRIKILNERGKRYGEVTLAAGKYSRVSGIQARTIKPDGTVVPVAADQIFEKVTFQIGNYKETAWVFSFPAVEPGAILEYRYQRNDNSITFIDPFYFAGPEFTLRARMTQAIPEDMGYALLCDLCPPSPQASVTDWREGKAKGKLYAQELHDLPGYRSELMMPPAREVTPRVEMVLQAWKRHAWWALGRQDRCFTDWASVSLWASAYYQDAVKNGTAALKPLVDAWAQGIADPQEKIKAVFRHVQCDVRYLPYTDVYGTSRSIETMLKENIADNEDKAVLLMAALKAMGVESYPALVSGRNGGSLNPKFFSLSQFTHAVVAVPQGSGYLWLDPTVAYAPFGFVPWKDSGADALLIKGAQGEMTTLPARNELSVSRFKVAVKPRADGKADLDVQAEFLGEDAVDLREDLVPASEQAREAYLQKWIAEGRPGAALRSHALENLEDVDKPLRVALSVEAPGLVTIADQAMLVRGCALTCEENNPVSRGARQYPFYVDIGWNEDETDVIQPPAGMTMAEAPPPAVARSVVGSFSLSCMSLGDGTVRCSRQFAARRNRWPATAQPEIRAMFDKVVAADRTAVALQKGGAEGAGR